MIKRPLTDEERVKPYAKYYDRPMTAPDPLLLAATRSEPIPPEQMLYPDRVEMLFQDAPENDLVGWGIMKDGFGYVSSRIWMPGVTPQMLAWWFAWHPLEDLRYMLWYPGRHFSAGLSEADRNKILDPSLDLPEKIADVTHIIQEDSRENDALTEIPPAFRISFRRPEELGIRPEWIGYPEQGFAVIASPHRNPDGSLPARPRIMLHTARTAEGGVVFRSRFWMGGYVLINGRAEHIGAGTPTPADAPKRLLEHSIREYTNLASFLPQLYREMKGRLEA